MAAARSGTSAQSRCLPRPCALASMLLRQVAASLPTYKQAPRGSGRDRLLTLPGLRGHRCRSGWPPQGTPGPREEGRRLIRYASLLAAIARVVAHSVAKHHLPFAQFRWAHAAKLAALSIRVARPGSLA